MINCYNSDIITAKDYSRLIEELEQWEATQAEGLRAVQRAIQSQTPDHEIDDKRGSLFEAKLRLRSIRSAMSAYHEKQIRQTRPHLKWVN